MLAIKFINCSYIYIIMSWIVTYIVNLFDYKDKTLLKEDLEKGIPVYNLITIPESESVTNFSSNVIKRSNTSLLEYKNTESLLKEENKTDLCFIKKNCYLCKLILETGKFSCSYRAYDNFICKRCFVSVQNKISI